MALPESWLYLPISSSSRGENKYWTVVFHHSTSFGYLSSFTTVTVSANLIFRCSRQWRGSDALMINIKDINHGQAGVAAGRYRLSPFHLLHFPHTESNPFWCHLAGDRSDQVEKDTDDEDSIKHAKIIDTSSRRAPNRPPEISNGRKSLYTPRTRAYSRDTDDGQSPSNKV